MMPSMRRETVGRATLIEGDCRAVLATLPANSVHCCVTSPPATDLAYCAGVIDSDGYIGVKRSTYSMRITKDSGQPTYSERVCVKQVEDEAVQLLRSLFGGTLTLAKPSAKKGRPLHSWQVTDKRAAACLLALLPFLRIKRQQAENCLSLRRVKEASKTARVGFGRGHAGAARRTDEHSQQMETAYIAGKTMNAVGTAERGNG